MPKPKEKVIHAARTISRIANFASIRNSKDVASINDDTTPNALDTIFLPRTYIIKQLSVPYSATGNLAVASVIFPHNANDKHSLQKYRGGFSKKNSLFRYKVIKSFELNISLDIETYRDSSTSIRAYDQIL